MVYKLKNGKELELKPFGIGAGRNNPESMYYGIEIDFFVEGDGIERLLEWSPSGKCIYVSKYFSEWNTELGLAWRSLVWNNQGPMEIDKSVKLEEYDILYPSGTIEGEDSSELKVKFINPILSLELE